LKLTSGFLPPYWMQARPLAIPNQPAAYTPGTVNGEMKLEIK